VGNPSSTAPPERSSPGLPGPSAGADRPPRRPRRWPAVVVGLVGALVAYVVIASPPAQPGGAAAESPGDPAGTPTAAPPADPSAPVTDREPLQSPTLGVSTPTIADLDRFIAATGTHPEVFDTFESWSLGRPLQQDVADAVAARGARLSVTWEPWDNTDAHTDQPDYTLASIIDGAHDSYIDMYASSVRANPHPVTIRLMHEMNGNWYPWGSGVNGNQPGEFVRAWQHVHDRFTALGVTNVTWLWAPNAVYRGSEPLVPLYPGDAYADAVGVSNYNWGDQVHDGFQTHWATFDALFDPTITELRSITGRPVWIAEVGSSNSGGNKAAWLAALLAELPGRPEIAGVVWFDQVDEAHGIDWRIENEPATARAWAQGFEARPTTTRPRSTPR
jgi:beta-mannanase